MRTGASKAASSQRGSARSGGPKPGKSRAANKPAAKGKPAKPKSPPKPKAARRKPATPPKKVRARTVRPKRTPSRPASSGSPALRIALIAGTILLALAATYFLWFRDSSFVAVEKVTVEGITGPEAAEVTAALTESAKGMTTLAVDEGELAAAVSQFPTVVSIQAQADFPHGLTVEVAARPPVITASDGGPPIGIAADGTPLEGVSVPEGTLPAIEVESLPVKGKLEGEPLALAQASGAAPEPLRTLIEGLEVDSGEGIQVTLEGGIPVKFGDPDDLEAKWKAVAAVLANPQVKTLTHLDVRVPERPSIGGAAPPIKGG